MSPLSTLEISPSGLRAVLHVVVSSTFCTLLGDLFCWLLIVVPPLLVVSLFCLLTSDFAADFPDGVSSCHLDCGMHGADYTRAPASLRYSAVLHRSRTLKWTSPSA